MSSYKIRNYTYKGIILNKYYNSEIILIKPIKNKIHGLTKTDHPILDVKFGIYNQIYMIIDAPKI